MWTKCVRILEIGKDREREILSLAFVSYLLRESNVFLFVSGMVYGSKTKAFFRNRKLRKSFMFIITSAPCQAKPERIFIILF